MNRRARQEREAQEKAYFRYEGGRRDPRYRERLAEIDRRYDHKRDKVERHLCNDEELESAPTEPSAQQSCTGKPVQLVSRAGDRLDSHKLKDATGEQHKHEKKAVNRY